jgi:hypothetical protein
MKKNTFLKKFFILTLIAWIVASFCLVQAETTYRIAFINEGGNVTPANKTVLPGLTYFEVDYINNEKHSQWYVDGVLQETDHSGTGGLDPSLGHTFTELTCTAIEIKCRVYNDEPCTDLNSTYTWNVSVGFNHLLTPASDWSIFNGSHLAGLSISFKFHARAGYTYIFKTGCFNEAQANYDTRLTILNSSCGQLDFNDNFCGSLQSGVRYASMVEQDLFVKLDGASGKGGNFTMAYKCENCVPEATTVTGGGSYCGECPTLNAHDGQGGSIYYQGTTSMGTSTTELTYSKSVCTSGTYFFRSRSPDGCWGTQGSATVTIYSKPEATTVSGGGLACDEATLTASGGAGGTIFYQGITNDGESTADTSTSIAVTNSGTYYFRSVNQNGCWGEPGSATVIISDKPEATIVSGAGIACGVRTLTAMGGAGGTIYYQGATGNGTGTAEPSTSEKVFTSGTYYFRAKNDAGCWGDEGSAAVTINPVPAATIISGEGAFCGSATLTATGGSGGIIYFQGTSNNGTSIENQSVSEVVSASGTYYFSSKSPEGCWGEQDSALVIITPNTVASVNITASPDTVINQGETVIYEATNTNEIPSPTYQWKINNMDVGLDNPVYSDSVFQNGDQISCTISSSALCIVGSPATSNIITMTVNLASGQEEISQINSLSIYPNPSSGEFMIKMNITQPGTLGIQLINVGGQVIFEEWLDNYSGEFNKTVTIDNQVKGIYMLHLITQKKKVTKKIILL